MDSEVRAVSHPDLGGLESPETLMPPAPEVVPTSETKLVLSREDLLQYQLISSKAQAEELRHALLRHQIADSERRLGEIAKEAREHLERIQTTYKVDMSALAVQEDGTLAPMPMDRYRNFSAQHRS